MQCTPHLPTANERPTPVKTFREEPAKTKGLRMVSAGYNYSLSGGLKNAIDWASRGADSPLLNKPVAPIGAQPACGVQPACKWLFIPYFFF